MPQARGDRMLEMPVQDRVRTGKGRSKGKVRRATGSMQNRRENNFKIFWEQCGRYEIKNQSFQLFL